MGEDTIAVEKIHINGKSCETYGLKIVNCEPFEVKKNKEHELMVEYQHESGK
jgi:hypothetical protein